MQPGDGNSGSFSFDHKNRTMTIGPGVYTVRERVTFPICIPDRVKGVEFTPLKKPQKPTPEIGARYCGKCGRPSHNGSLCN